MHDGRAKKKIHDWNIVTRKTDSFMTLSYLCLWETKWLLPLLLITTSASAPSPKTPFLKVKPNISPPHVTPFQFSSQFSFPFHFTNQPMWSPSKHTTGVVSLAATASHRSQPTPASTRYHCTKFVILDMGCCRTAYCFENNNNNNNHAVFRWVRWDWIKITIGFTGNSKFKRHICWCRWNLFNCQSKPLWFFHHTHRNKSAVW